MSEPDFSKIISKEMARARHDGAADERAAIVVELRARLRGYGMDQTLEGVIYDILARGAAQSPTKETTA